MVRSLAQHARWYLCLALCASSAEAIAQAVSPLPYDQRLLSDPNVGNVQGLQRYGRRLRTDPEIGMGHGYQVFPRWVLESGPGGSAALEPVRDALDRRFQEFAAAQADFLEDPKANKEALLTAIRRFQTTVASLEPLLPVLAQGDLDELRNVLGRFEMQAARIQNADDVDLSMRNAFEANLRNMALRIRRLTGLRTSPRASAASPPQPFRATAGMRNLAPARTAAPAAAEAAAPQPLGQAMTYNAATDQFQIVPLFHQPLIQVKVRVVEVVRGDSMQAATVLDYIGGRAENNTRFAGGNINKNGEKTSAVTRFDAPIGIAPGTAFPAGIEAVDGSGALINLTTEHINLLTSLLAAEFGADVVTAPEVVTLNGQNVEFISGRKLPFALGLKMVQSDSESTTNFFYKNVGTYISVTPRIVNWGKHAEMRGKTPLTATEIASWNGLIEWMLDGRNLQLPTHADENVAGFPAGFRHPTSQRLLPYAGNDRPVPYELRRDILLELSQYPGDELRRRLGGVQEVRCTEIDGMPIPDLQGPTLAAPTEGGTGSLESESVPPPAPHVAPPPEDGLASGQRESIPAPMPLRRCILRPAGDAPCDWQPEECTIDLEIVVRLSDVDNTNLKIGLRRGDEPDPDRTEAAALEETDVRAVANVLQVKSGHGVVMAGLIGMRDTEHIAKVPVLGDAPVIGYLFRSKQTTREKTETLIFVEAKVLPGADRARCESARDFGLSLPYVCGDLLENPLEFGSFRAGFGTYLPPHSHQEKVFWERFAGKLRKASTQIDDALQ